MPILKLTKRWFSLQGTVSREEYLLTGVGLMILKYAVEAGVIGYFTGKFYTPLDFLNPLLSARSQFTVGAPEWLGMAWVLWTIPFVCIAVAMSMRRAIGAGASPWAGMFVLVPIINLPLMLYLACIPQGYANRNYVEDGSARSSLVISEFDLVDEDRANSLLAFQAAFVGIAVGFAYMFCLVLFGVYVLKSYGAAMFFGTPLVAGAATAYTYNRWCPQLLGSTIALSLTSGVFFAAGLLLMGLEGIVCIAMAAPIILPVGILGALIGRAIAIQRNLDRERNDKGLLGCLLVLPFLAGAESFIAPQTEFEVLTVVEIAAPPERVWECVVSFPEITERPEWFFRWGISCPQGARIDGSRVGAIRHCDFTTGSFVEPVTAWEPPRLLAFDVSEQPEPMTELSPYRHIHPPHLDGSFRSTHGEFRLIPLANGGTRLEGRTWYKLEIYPHSYWTLWTDWLVHRIHGRVLRHIKQLAESSHEATPRTALAIFSPAKL